MADNDPFEERRKLTFAQAEGAEPLPNQLRKEELSRELRAKLWYIFYKFLNNSADYRGNFKDSVRKLFEDIHVVFYHRMIDEFDPIVSNNIDEIKSLFQSGDYVKIFDWIQFVLRHPRSPGSLATNVDIVLRQCRAAFRVLDGTTISPIGSEEELRNAEHAFVELRDSELNGARAHLQKASSELTIGNWSSSVRESVHAVESVLRILEPTGNFKKAMHRIQEAVGIHGALATGFNAIYGYSSDEQGIRHSLLDKDESLVDEADALFMFGACAAFIS